MFCVNVRTKATRSRESCVAMWDALGLIYYSSSPEEQRKVLIMTCRKVKCSFAFQACRTEWKQQNEVAV